MGGPELDAAALTEWREATRSRALELGFSLAGFTTAEPLGEVAERRWRRWREAGRAGEMTYLERPEPRRTHPRDLLAEAESVLVVAAGYFDGDHEAGARGKVARYAWGEDYHFVLRRKLGELGRWIESEAPAWGYKPPIHWRAVTDSAPLDERALAVRAGLGFIGKNTLLLHPEKGSWSLLGELLLSAPFPPDRPLSGSCGSCRLCLEACPTEAFPGPYELDPRRCISYLTIEQKAPIAEELAERMEGWAFGCDICQEVCPLNEQPMTRLIEALGANAGAGPAVDGRWLGRFGSGKAYARATKNSPLSRPGLKGMRRNLEALGLTEAPTQKTPTTGKVAEK